MYVQLTLTQTHTYSCLFTELLAPGALSSKYGSQSDSSPPPLLFSPPGLRRPGMLEQQFNPTTGWINISILLSSSLIILVFFFISLIFFYETVAPVIIITIPAKNSHQHSRTTELTALCFHDTRISRLDAATCISRHSTTTVSFSAA